MTCEETTLSLGAYLLGALEPEERRQVREHLSACPACAAEYADLKDLPAVLDRVTLEDLHAPPVSPSPDLFDRVASAAAAEDRRVRRRWLLVAAGWLMLAWLAYRAAVAAAIAYGESIRTAVDLHRFTLLQAFHLPLPATPEEERALNARLSRFLLQGVPLDAPYRH